MSAKNSRSSDGLRETAAMSERILVLAPTRGDAALCRRLLGEAGFIHDICTQESDLCDALQRPSAVLVVAEESLQGPAGACIRAHLAAQPAWSSLPVIVLAAQESTRRLQTPEAYDAYGHITLLERPVRMATFLGTLRLALQEHRQQQRIGDLLAERAEAIRLRDEFLAMLGHELRNPLAAILTSAEVLEAVAPDSERAAYCRGLIRPQAMQMKRLLDDLSDMSRMNRYKLFLEREPVDLRQVLKDVASQVAEMFTTRRQRLELDLDGPPVPLLADPMRLRQVFANLLTNANRYTPKGGHIRVSLDTGDGLARVAIRDDGAGLRAETLQRIFEPFYQDRSQAGHRAGLGIGLTLARSLVQMHAGTITAQSAGPGCGSEFIVTLPLHDGTTDAAASAQPEQSPRAAARHILLIEDNHAFAMGLKHLLEAHGHQVDVAHDGTDGLRMAQEQRPDVVLLDIGLPGLDGYAVARRLRRIAGLSQVRVIAVTGFSCAADQQRARHAGIDHHLVKPVAMADLEAAIA